MRFLIVVASEEMAKGRHILIRQAFDTARSRLIDQFLREHWYMKRRSVPVSFGYGFQTDSAQNRHQDSYRR
jgi:hypothetical protein